MTKQIPYRKVCSLPFFSGWEIIERCRGESQTYWLNPILSLHLPFVVQGRGISLDHSRNPGRHLALSDPSCDLSSFLFLRERENHQITPPSQGGAVGSVRLLLTISPACSFSCRSCQVRGISLERFPRPWLTCYPCLFLFLRGSENHQMMPLSQGGAAGSVRLLLT